jgi:hypothetical protein
MTNGPKSGIVVTGLAQMSGRMFMVMTLAKDTQLTVNGPLE